MGQDIITYSLWALTLFLFVGSLIPFSKVPHGALRAFDFPREQFFGLSVLMAFAFPFVQGGTMLIWAFVLLAITAIIQLFHIVKFTPIWPRQSVDADESERDNQDGQINLLAANVKQSNRAYDRLITLTREHSPDILMAIEVDHDWINALSEAFRAEYAHWIEVPKSNGYGMCVLSRLPLSDIEVRELITEGVPSIRTRVTLRNDENVRLYVVHPEPPVIDHDTMGRDGEIALIGMEAADDELPAIVTGDLNDVAWSTTTRRFQRLSRLLDPRVGRGFYNTFSATMPWIRWPLDHLFHDPQFRLVEMARLGKIGSDHFPMWFALALARTEAIETDPGTADADEKQDVEQMIDAEKKRDREAIGSHWEDE